MLLGLPWRDSGAYIATRFLKEKIMSTAISTFRPGLLGRGVIEDVFDNFFSDFPSHLRRSTQGYPVADIYRDSEGNTVMEFALAGFTKDDLTIEVKPEKRSITVSAETVVAAEDARRIARRSFQKTYVNYDDNLDLSGAEASFENGLLMVCVPQRPEVTPVTIKIT
jgi:HSP20 family molecular chaperone IbpA